MSESFRSTPVVATITSLFGALWWGVIFRAPGLVFFGTIPLVLVFLALEWFSFRRLWAYLTVWIVAGLVAAGIFRSPLSSVHFELFGRGAAALLPASIAGYLYWLLAGRTSGQRIDGWKAREWRPRGLFNYAAYAVLAYLTFQLAGYLYYGGKLFWVSYISEPSRGEPAFGTPFGREPSAAHKVALMDFPDPESCLEYGVVDLTTENLKKMDWDKIDNSAEAEVCTFRLLGSYDDLSYATAWFEAQGFSVPSNFSSDNPFAARDGKLRVYGSWSIREHGPRFPTRGVIQRLFGSIPYGMSVDSTWSQDGRRLLWVNVGFSTL